jgi:acyl-CoA synthetase (AMP-forming)/AMP-acid ligase II
LVSQFQAPAASDKDPRFYEFSQSAVIKSATALAASLGLTPDDRVLSTLPLHLPLGQTALFACLAARSVLIVSSAVDIPSELATNLSIESASVLIASPETVGQLLSQPKLADAASILKKLLIVATSASQLNPQLIAQLRSALPSTSVSFGFAHPTVPGLLLHTPSAQSAFAEGAVAFGKPLAGLTVKVVGPDGKSVPTGKVGSLLIQGAGLASCAGPNGVNTGISASINQDGTVLLQV